MKILVGNTGLIGKTLQESDHFVGINTSNINQYGGLVENGDELYLSCLPAAKWVVNQRLGIDIENINSIMRSLSMRRYSKIVLFSTIDVYSESPVGVNENFIPTVSKLSYGGNRYLFELYVRSLLKTDDLKIFRLPALYNKHIKKNILFDLINNNNADQINLNSAYQWYNLDKLYSDVIKYSKNYPDKTVFNLFPEPIETRDIVSLFPQYNLTLSANRVEYMYATKYSATPYTMSRQDSFEDIKKFVNEISSK
jgi:hypothetical protein